MPVAFSAEIAQRIRASGVVAVLILRELEQAVPLGRALVEGGISAIELTLRTPAALPALARLKREVPQLLIGAGTVLSPADLRAAREAGADFAVSPGANIRVLEEAARTGFSFAPGIATPTDIESALEQGCRLLKFFPAEPLGGLPYLRAISAPFEHLGAEYIPLGGMNEQSMVPYLEHRSTAAIGGSWMATPELVAAEQWDKITALSRQAVETARRVRGAQA
jgi:2-dehydro-3-deoxyphosphogluconate aldolase/(4S)-4-hydroxy-2-oxoglutarate aldolase